MKLADIIALAKQGYKVSDIKELLSLADKEPAEQEPAKEQEPAEQKPAEEEKPAAEQEPAKEQESAAEQEPDYKALYEAEKKKRQEENRRREAGEPDVFDEGKFLQDIASMY